MSRFRTFTCAGCQATFDTVGAYMNHGRYSKDCSPEKRFWGQVDRSAGPNACWPWVGAVHRYGYGACSKTYGDTRAHRLAWILTNGPIPDGKVLCHSCDNKICVNPAHLHVGSQAENIADALRKGLSSTKLKPKDVLALRRELESYKLVRKLPAGVLQQFAERYGVTKGTISLIRHGRKWQSITVNKSTEG